MYRENKYNELICELAETIGVESTVIEGALKGLKRKEIKRAEIEKTAKLLREHFTGAVFNIPLSGFEFYYLKVRKISFTDTMIYFDGDVLSKGITLKIGSTCVKYDANTSISLSYFGDIDPDDEDIVNKLSEYLVMDFDLIKKKIELSLKYIDIVSKHFLPEKLNLA